MTMKSKTASKKSNPKKRKVQKVADDKTAEDEDLWKLMYRPLPDKDKNIKVDERFKRIFEDKEFVGGSRKFDERGARLLEKPTKRKTPSDDEDSESADEDSGREIDSEDEETDLEEELRRESADDEDDSVWDALLDGDATETVSEPTRRLCLKHMDWSRVRARDIFLLARSFLPPAGRLLRVTVLPSELGVRALPAEEARGPPVLADLDALGAAGEAREDEEEEEGEALTTAQLRRAARTRRYEVERLKHFFALLEFDSPASADAVYEAADGAEYEASGCRVDLSFVEDGRAVDAHLRGPEAARWRSMVSVWPPAGQEAAAEAEDGYRPAAFTNGALRHTHRFDLSWDDTPAERTQWLEAVAARDDFDEAWQAADGGLGRFLALSASSDDDEDAERRRRLIRGVLDRTATEERRQARRQARGQREARRRQGLDVGGARSSSESSGDDQEAAGGAPGGVEAQEDSPGEQQKEKEEEDLFEAVPEAPPAPAPAKKKRRAEAEAEVRGGKKKKKRRSQLQLAKAKRLAAEKERTAAEEEPALGLLVAELRGAAEKRTPAPLEQDQRFAALFSDPEFAKDNQGLLGRASARL